MPEDRTSEAWREHARLAYTAGTDEKLGEPTAAEVGVLAELAKLRQLEDRRDAVQKLRAGDQG